MYKGWGPSVLNPCCKYAGYRCTPQKCNGLLLSADLKALQTKAKCFYTKSKVATNIKCGLGMEDECQKSSRVKDGTCQQNASTDHHVTPE
eukprot:1137362-Pelagomonas_calceolata.AAC.5